MGYSGSHTHLSIPPYRSRLLGDLVPVVGFVAHIRLGIPVCPIWPCSVSPAPGFSSLVGALLALRSIGPGSPVANLEQLYGQSSLRCNVSFVGGKQLFQVPLASGPICEANLRIGTLGPLRLSALVTLP